MSKHCVDLELAKELKKKGYPQKGDWGYFNIAPKGHEDHIILCHYGSGNLLVAIAPTSDDLLEKMIDLDITIKTTFDIVYVGEIDYDGYFEILGEDEKTANALAKMWIYQKEKYI